MKIFNTTVVKIGKGKKGRPMWCGDNNFEFYLDHNKKFHRSIFTEKTLKCIVEWGTNHNMGEIILCNVKYKLKHFVKMLNEIKKYKKEFYKNDSKPSKSKYISE